MRASEIEGEVQGVTQDEDAQIGGTPAVYANKVYLTANSQGAKITFAERFKVGGEPAVQARMAVFLLPQDIVALHRLLEPLVQRAEAVEGSSTETQTNG